MNNFKFTYCFDLDGTICNTPNKKYKDASPFYKIVNKVNQLFDDGNKIVIYTARGGTSGVDYHELTFSQLKKWGVLYHELIDKNKPHFDLLIDDKAINVQTWRNQCGIQIIGFLNFEFDPSHIVRQKWLFDCKRKCDYLIVGIDECIDGLDEKLAYLNSIKYIDEVKIYSNLNDILGEIEPDVIF